MPDQPTGSCIFSLIGTLLGGGIIGTVLGHWLAIGREKRDRRRDFLGFMSRFRSEAEADDKTLSMDFTLSFKKKIHEFRYKQALIRSDLPKGVREAFDEAVESLCGLGRKQADRSSYRIDAKKVCTAIDDVLRLAR